MRKHATSALVFAVVLGIAGFAHAGDKLRLEKVDTSLMPRLKMYLTFVDTDGRPITGHAKDDFRMVIDSAEQGPAVAAQGFDESKEPINVVVVAQLGSAMQQVIDSEKSAVGALADSLPAKSKMAVLGYALDTKRLAELGNPVDAESAAKTMAIDADSPEMHMTNAVRTALDLLAAAPKTERKLIVVFSDGIDADMDARTFSSIGKRAFDAGVVIDTIGYNEFDQAKLRTLGTLAKQSGGIERVCKTGSDISNHFSNVIDEIKKQYVVTFETILKDQKPHLVQVIGANGGRDTYSNELNVKFPAWVGPGTIKTGGGSRWWLWLLLGVVGIGLIGLIAWLIFREKPEEMPDEEPAAAPAPVAAAPAAPMKTMALNVDVRGGTPAVGWLVGTGGKYADQTFKLKPSRTVIGTGADCDVKVDDQFMSSKHCEVRFENGSFKLFDLGSTNGIVVNDKKVREHELVDNDQFRLGRTEFKFKSIT